MKLRIFATELAVMSYNKKQLNLKRVTPHYTDQYNELMRYVFQVTIGEIERSGYEEGELVRSKRPVLEHADVLGWFTPDDRLVSSICTYPFQVNIHGKIYNMGGVTGVGTYPEYASTGLMKDLIQLALERMRVKGQYISYLYPYSVPYYRKKGWEIMSDYITFTLKDTQMPHHVRTEGYVERLSVLDKAVVDVYDRFSHKTHGAMIRNNIAWNEYWRWENEDERIAAVYYNAKGVPQGYMIYWVENDIFHIREMVYITEDARHELWNFVRAHDSMIDNVKGNIYMDEPLAFLLDESQITETIEPYFMARIVDAGQFLADYPFDDEITGFHFQVTDPIAKWNNGIFGLIQENNTVQVVREAVGGKVELDIQTLSTLMMSYKSPAYLHKIGRLKTNPDTLRMLEKIIPTEKPYFSDYF